MLAAAASSAQTSRVTFGPATSTDLGVSNPAGRVVGDFDQDGHLDLIVTSKGAPTSNVKLLTGDGTGSLSQARAFSFADASAIAAADFNGDGALDVAMTQDIEGKGGGYGDPVCSSVVGIAIFLGPNMSSARCLATFSRATAIQAGDFDGNGRPEIVVLSAVGQGLLIYSGLFFVPPYAVSVTSVPGSGVLATGMAPPVDLNGDGHLDLVVSHSTGVNTYLGNGNGTFRVGGNAGGSNKTQAVAVGDLNGDGVPDVASVENTTNGRLLVAFGAGDGSFSTAAPVSTIGIDLSDVAIGDIDHDGHADVVVAHKGGGTIRIFFGNGDGTFAANEPLAISVKPKFLAVRDWDEDGDLDLGIIDTSVGGLNALAWVARQEGSGPLDVTPPTVALTSPSAGSIVSGTVAVTATASDDVGVTRVEFFAGLTLIAQSAGPNYMVSWNTAALPNGPVSLTARAFDAVLNQADSLTVQVTVENAPVPDTTPPVVTVPPNATVEATGPTGAVFTYAASATDNIDGVVPVTCTPASGSTFPLGTTTVTCTATDTHGNIGSASFTVTVTDIIPPSTDPRPLPPRPPQPPVPVAPPPPPPGAAFITRDDSLSVEQFSTYADAEVHPRARVLIPPREMDPRIATGNYGGERWVSPPTCTRVGEGKTCTVEARVQGSDATGRSVSFTPKWTSADPEMVTVTPSEGNQVKILVLRPGQTSVRVSSPAFSKELTIKAAYQNNVLQVDISQK